MDLLSPDDTILTGGGRRKSLCNGIIFAVSNSSSGGSASNGTQKKKERVRRGSLSEPPCRRASLVQRWVKHISDAAEAFKTRTKGNHDQASADDPSSLSSATNLTTTNTTTTTTVSTNPASTATNISNNQPPPATSISNSSTKESIESTPEKEISLSSNNNNINNNNNNNSQDYKDRYRSGSQQQDQHHYHKPSGRTRRKTVNSENEKDQDDQNLDGKKKRIASGGDYSDDNVDVDDDDDDDVDDNGHHNEYRNDDGDDDDDEDNDFSNNKNKKRGVRKRNSEYSNNSNNTRTITQQSSLVAPSEVHISVSPSLTAEPVLTPNERLRRLDESIRMTLAEKQKVVCDMFRVPNEHFTAIADIVSQPEAPKDPSDIVLAAFAQVQTLTETLNEYIRVSTHQEISAVSTSLCDECHNKNNLQLSPKHHHQYNIIPPQIASPLQPQRAAPQIPVRQSMSSSQIDNNKDVSNIPILSSSTTTTAAATTTTTTAKYADIVRNNNIGATGHPPPSPSSQLPIDPILDDDGYCEIDELRLPTVLSSTQNHNNNNNNSSTTATSTGGLILSTSPPSVQTASITNTTTMSSNSNSSSLSSPLSSAAASAPVSIDNKTAELKRQSTISADSIPEETEHEIHAELIASKLTMSSVTAENDEQKNSNNDDNIVVDENDDKVDDRGGDNNYNDDDEIVGHMEINETYVTQQIPNTATTTTSTITNKAISIGAAATAATSNAIGDRPNLSSLHQCIETTCAANRLAHATSLAPAVPCHLISNIVTALNLQISQLLPKLNERDIEREKLRKENQHLRELLNSMHDRERVSNERESPNHAFDITNSNNVSHSQMTTSASEVAAAATTTAVPESPSTSSNHP